MCGPAILTLSLQHGRTDICSPHAKDKGNTSEESNKTVDLGWTVIPSANLDSMVTLLKNELPHWTKSWPNPSLDVVSSGIACAALSG